jgi:hypothetical protein
MKHLALLLLLATHAHAALTNPSGTGGSGGGDASAANQVSELAKLDSIVTGTNKIPASPATDRTTAAAPFACRISDGSSFLDPRQVTVQNASLAVTGPLTDTQLRASVVPVSFTQPALVAGSAIIGKVGIDQTTPGTTNKVSIGTDGTVTSNDGGTKITAATMPAGGVGLTGWISAVWYQLTQGINVTCIAGCSSAVLPATYVYSNGATTYTPAATPNDMIQVQGSATKTVKIKSVYICATATAAGHAKFYMRKTSTQGSGGTAVIVSANSKDSNNAVATAVVRQFNADNTTAGTLVGTLIGKFLYFGITAGTTTTMNACQDMIVDLPSDNPSQDYVLRGTSEFWSFGKNDEALPAGFAIQTYRIITTEE